MDNISFSQNLDFQQYFWFTIRYTYLRPLMWVVHAICIIGVLLGILSFLFLDDGSSSSRPWPFFQPLFILIGVYYIFLPLWLYVRLKNSFKSSQILSNTIQYEISSEGIVVSGESYQSTMAWDVIYKVKEFGDRFLVYLNRGQAIHFEKASFPSVAEIEIFKSLVRRQTNIKGADKL